MIVSVITPTYNRADLLKNAYNSLVNQTNHSLEWIIVDDGSVDNTQTVVKEFLESNKFPIIYIYKENGGKHTAVNVGVKEARGDYCMVLDSDDKLTNDAIDTIIKDFEKYHSESKICGLSYNKRIINADFNSKFMEETEVVSNHIEFRYNQKHPNDREEVYKTEILKKYPFPVIEGERFLSEAVVWNTIAYLYDTVYINKDIYIAEYLPGGLSSSSIISRVNNPKGCLLNYEIMMREPFKLFLRFKYSILYNTFCFFANINIKERLKKDNKPLLIVTLPFGFLVYMKWKKYQKTDGGKV